MRNSASTLDATPAKSLWRTIHGDRMLGVFSHTTRTVGAPRTNPRCALPLLSARHHPAAQTSQSRIYDEGRRIDCLSTAMARSGRHGASPQRLGDLRNPLAGG